MIPGLKRCGQRVLHALGYKAVPLDARIALTHDMDDPGFVDIYPRCRDYTMTTTERMYTLYKSVEYVVQAGIPGAIVECGVWRGGSAMLAAYTLLRLGEHDRPIYLYDTFRGMPEPAPCDVRWNGEPAYEQWANAQRGDKNAWCLARLAEVEKNLDATGYPKDKLVFVEGKVEETLPGTAPDALSVLRLDTDFYASTYHELQHLYPRLSPGGVLILDDYGHFQGVKQAVDQYFREQRIAMLLTRVDDACRMGIKTDTG